MKGGLTLDKVNAAINDMASFAGANAQIIIAAPKKELRDIATTEAVKGKHFFLESDIKGPALKLDNTGKAFLNVLRHLGRISETRIGHHRVIILLKPH
ncbi:spindle and kinetochore-associated protein 1 homolog [Humulus lupulus]|uniref:spindle and kinetochore-associated protein 1 homolog n=1 Tax=Humulus lupulus TaxID=3486 RepID=UPI002B407AA0|nr:spindle and kinetochore-associated protein 1 homolog [Humulus lupulus]